MQDPKISAEYANQILENTVIPEIYETSARFAAFTYLIGSRPKGGKNALDFI